MRELHFGGWLAPNLFFLGASSIINLKFQLKSEESASSNLRIYGCSGIFKPYSFFKNHPKLPFDSDSKRNCYHVRMLEVIRGLLIEGNHNFTEDSTRNPINIGISHDWPRGAHKYGDYESLIKVKPYFEKDVN